jgi:hypothetical protein
MARQLEEINSSGELISIKKGGAGPEKEVTTQEYVDAADALKQNAADLFNDVKAIMEGGQLETLRLSVGAQGFPSDDYVPTVADFARVQMMKWKGIWAVGSYKWLDVVRDGDWTMIANKDTSDRPAPQPVGSKVTDITVAPSYVAQSFIGVVHSGTRYVFTKNGWVSELEVYAPELTSDTNYRIVLVDQTDAQNPVFQVIDDPILIENGWATVALSNTIVTVGSDWVVYIDTLNSGGTSQVTGGWTFQGSAGTPAVPLTSNWTKDNGNSLLRIDKTDLDTVNRGTELLGFVPGTDIQIVETSQPTNSMTFKVLADPVDGGSYVEYTVDLVQQIGTLTVGQATTWTADIPVVQATKYAEDTGYWTANPCSFATCTGYLAQDGVPIGVGPNLYGIRLTFQEATISEDWDLVAFSGSSGSGGGGGGAGLAYNFAKSTNVTITALNTDDPWTTIGTVTMNGAQPGIYEYKISVTYTLDSTTTSAFLRFSTDGGATWNNFQAEPKDISDARAVFYSYPIEVTAQSDLKLDLQGAKELLGDTMVVTFADVIIDQKTSG